MKAEFNPKLLPYVPKTAREHESYHKHKTVSFAFRRKHEGITGWWKCLTCDKLTEEEIESLSKSNVTPLSH